MYFRIIIALVLQISSAVNVIPKVNIDLDQEPNKVWIPALETIIKLHGYENSFGATFRHHNETVFDFLSSEHYKIFSDSVKRNFPRYAAELQGVVDFFNRSDVTFEYLSAWVYFHELGHTNLSKKLMIRECTGVLFQTNGKVIHGRNMDQYPVQARNLVLHLKLYQNNKIIGEVVDWYWFKTGFVTAFKPNVVSLEENWRDGDIENYQNIDQLLDKVQQGIPTLAWHFRFILQSQHLNTFEKVVDFLEKIPVAAALFDIVAGTQKDQGAIIVRDPVKKFETYHLGTNGQGDDPKFLVVTNYDLWETDPLDDNRRTVAEILLAQLPSELQNELGVFSVMDTYPINSGSSFYTTIMVPQTGYIASFGQNLPEEFQ